MTYVLADKIAFVSINNLDSNEGSISELWEGSEGGEGDAE